MLVLGYFMETLDLVITIKFPGDCSEWVIQVGHPIGTHLAGEKLAVFDFNKVAVGRPGTTSDTRKQN